MPSRSPKKKIDTIEKLAGLVVESLDDMRSEMSARFDIIGDQISALQERVTAVESKIAGLHRRIDQGKAAKGFLRNKVKKPPKPLGLGELATCQDTRDLRAHRLGAHAPG